MDASKIFSRLTIKGVTSSGGSSDFTDYLVKLDENGEIASTIIPSTLDITGVSGDFTIGGNLIVSGATTTISSETLTINDNVIVLNNNVSSGSPTENGGIQVRRGASTSASILWDETTDSWKVGLAGSEVAISLSTDLSTHVADQTLHLTSSQNTWIDAITASSTEINRLVGVTSGIQGQLDLKQPLDGDLTAIAAFTGSTTGYAKRTGTNTWSLLSTGTLRSELSVNLVENIALSTWNGTETLRDGIKVPDVYLTNDDVTTLNISQVRNNWIAKKAGLQEIVEIICGSDSSGSLYGASIYLNYLGGDTEVYLNGTHGAFMGSLNDSDMNAQTGLSAGDYCYNTDHGSQVYIYNGSTWTPQTPPASSGVYDETLTVNFITNDDAATIATKIETVLLASDHYANVTRSTATLTITAQFGGSLTDASTSVGWTVNTTQQGNDNAEYYIVVNDADLTTSSSFVRIDNLLRSVDIGSSVQGFVSASSTGTGALVRADTPTFTGTVNLPATTIIGNVDATEIGYLNGVNANIQTQFTGKAATGSNTDITALRGLTNGSTGTLAICTAADTTSGLYFATNQVFIRAGGTNCIQFNGGTTNIQSYTTLPGIDYALYRSGESATRLDLSASNTWRFLVSDAARLTINSTGVTVAGTATLPATKAIVLPHVMTIVGDSMSNAGTEYWPAGFGGVATGLTGSPHSYNAVVSYPGGDATGVQPNTSWPEKFAALTASSPISYNFAYAGRTIADARRFYNQEAHRIAPHLTGVASGIVFFLGINDLIASSAATAWALLKELVLRAKVDGYSPVVVATLPPSTDGDGTYAVDGTWDSRRLTFNSSIIASTDIDIVVDVNSVAGLMATNSPTSGQHYTHNATYYAAGDPIHFSEAGNVLFANALFQGLTGWSKSIISNTQYPTRDRLNIAYEQSSPWTTRRVKTTDLSTAASGGEAYTGESPIGAVGIRNGTANGNYGLAYYRGVFYGGGTGFNGASESTKGRIFIDWGRPITVAFSFHTEFASTAYANSQWQASFGKEGSTAGLLGSGDYAIGIKLTRPDTSTINVYASASNGTANSLTLLGTAADGVIHNVLIDSDGNGNLTVNLDGTVTTIANVAPYAVFSSNRGLAFESATTGGDAATAYAYFSDTVITYW